MKRERGKYLNMWGSVSGRGNSKSCDKKVLSVFKNRAEAREAERLMEWVESGSQRQQWA